MRDPDHLLEMSSDDDSISVIKFTNIPDFDIPDYNLSDEKDFKKYILDIKNTVRKSFEYQEFVQFLRNNLDMNKCSFYENVNNIDTANIKIHIHHDPFTIEDIIYIVVRKRQAMFEPLDIELVCEEVMKLHYQLKVGLIPLAETPHELVHNSYLFIPTTALFGNYKQFVEEYREFITDDQLDVLDKIEEYTEHYDYAKQTKVFEKHYTYIDVSGNWELPTYQSIIDMMKEIVRDKQVSITVDQRSN